MVVVFISNDVKKDARQVAEDIARKAKLLWFGTETPGKNIAANFKRAGHNFISEFEQGFERDFAEIAKRNRQR